MPLAQNTFGGRQYELTVGGESQSSRGGRFNAKRVVQPPSNSIFDQIEDNLHPYKNKKRNRNSIRQGGDH